MRDLFLFYFAPKGGDKHGLGARLSEETHTGY